ncbi:acetoin dehydrogenase dihydrolipoyllysine-residue acetyltransferase subunit [Acetobacter oeni]|uniref:Branched-chain alpha-keto acid dehydrogenase subunit E2 n=1 Tax=Acetobacter oeni TaxID=304077 RepID=A0A511XK44_9PROT|nr:acetoin dehydrogenase dihydrolipoyllysine-residue acetyltransferase subunit [Acetobacter oeni]MBB3883121.1 pyruvate dehydrogenase E2 component (dihydrolipoamide acetyltransferase) [Acetobacter oeni]NHO19239.1 acetoin dehydrogenase dihydrolipoyllysine-residue acetyltransferase subunit [Acetobacter oeni]GBR07048.1 branched-chain alpha-keto acid dehydrogenase subunit E2 [Acetobacter oeni LMG 21952]GEN63302.1 branched-chain alpha-keto acid dehydrogenase subunit E2 [Acetobacter oeni]
MSGTITPVTMPKFGLAMTEGKLASWSVKPGATVKAGQEIADIETSKITNGYESPAEGILRRQVASEGDTLPVGALLGVLAPESVSDEDIDAFVKKFNEEFSSGEESAAGESAPQRKTVAVGDLDLSVLESGADHGGVPVLLIHGFGGDLTNWMLNQPALAETHRVIAFDLPGHGESTKDVGDGTPAGFAATIAKLIAELGTDRVHVVGHSLGGAIALELAGAHGDTVASLTLIDPAGLGTDINMTFINGYIEADRRKTLEPVIQYLVHDKSLVTRAMVENIIRFKRLDGVVKGLRTIADVSFPDGKQGFPLRSVLEAYKGPVQVLWGEDDEILSVSGADGLPASVKVTRYPATGHMPQLEKSSEVNRAVSSFIG